VGQEVVNYAFYLLHRSVVVVIGRLVLACQASVTVKFQVIGVASLIVTLVICEALISRTNLARFLSGRK
jgi:hypothetical protein